MYPSVDSQRATVRHATTDDIATILLLIRELADSVGLLHEVETTPELLRATLYFEKDSAEPDPTASTPIRPARCLLLFNMEGIAVGFAVYFYNYSTWRARPGVYLEDLFVRPEERHKGYGTRLLSEIAKIVVEAGGARLDWNVLKTNGPAIRFYESLGASMLNQWAVMRLDGDRLDQLASMT